MEKSESLRKPDWSTWGLIPVATLEEVVALSCDVDPDCLDDRDYFFNHPIEFSDRLKIASAHLDGHGLPSCWKGLEQMIRLGDFAEWADSLKLSLPEEFPRNFRESVSDSSIWSQLGGYDTKLLRHLAEAGGKFWKNYDPNDHTTAPTNKQVIEWLMARGVSSRMAVAMATILRVDGLPTGPRS